MRHKQQTTGRKGAIKMKTYDVTIQATVRKTIRVEANNSDAAYEEAHEQFTTECDGDEHYDEQTIEINEVTE